MIKTRFAPSNTGKLSAGNCRSALFAYAFARKNNAKFHVRIEDTDTLRSTKESLLDIMQNLEWLGIDWDVGPSIQDIINDNYSSDHFQSKQGKIYTEFTQKLLSSGHAYEKDGCIFFKMPHKEFVLNDIILGVIKFPSNSQKDFIIRRADGSHLFHLTNVVSDIISEMTHLIKGNDHVANFPKHAALFEALKFPIPEYCHLPLLLDQSGQKISKRRNDQNAMLSDLRKQGYLPSTIVNALGLAGWSNPEGKEEFDLDYMCNHFDLKDCMKSNSRYDPKKLKSINGIKINTLSTEQFRNELFKYGISYYNELLSKFSKAQFEHLASLYHCRSKTLSEPFEQGRFLVEDVPYDNDAMDKILIRNNHEGAMILDEIYELLSSLDTWQPNNINKIINDYSKNRKISVGKIAQPLRVAVTGSSIGPPTDQTLIFLGKEITLERISKCLSMCKSTEFSV